jgi:hypothetical protein
MFTRIARKNVKQDTLKMDSPHENFLSPGCGAWFMFGGPSSSARLKVTKDKFISHFVSANSIIRM